MAVSQTVSFYIPTGSRSYILLDPRYVFGILEAKDLKAFCTAIPTRSVLPLDRRPRAMP